MGKLSRAKWSWSSSISLIGKDLSDGEAFTRTARIGDARASLNQRVVVTMDASNLIAIRGVAEARARMLHEAGLQTVEAVAGAGISHLATVLRVGASQAGMIRESARTLTEYTGEPVPKEPSPKPAAAKAKPVRKKPKKKLDKKGDKDMKDDKGKKKSKKGKKDTKKSKKDKKKSDKKKKKKKK